MVILVFFSLTFIGGTKLVDYKLQALQALYTKLEMNNTSSINFKQTKMSFQTVALSSLSNWLILHPLDTPLLIISLKHNLRSINGDFSQKHSETFTISIFKLFFLTFFEFLVEIIRLRQRKRHFISVQTYTIIFITICFCNFAKNAGMILDSLSVARLRCLFFNVIPHCHQVIRNKKMIKNF